MADHPSRDELLCMAYVDDELDAEARATFETRLASEPELAREVTSLRRLELFARTAAPPEPIELEWLRLEAEPLQRSLVTIGWVATVAGALGLCAVLLFALWSARIELWEKSCLSVLIAGLTIIFLTIVRRRWRSRPYDPYTAVQR